MIVSTGRIMLMGRAGTPTFASSISTSNDTSGYAPSRRTFPSSRTRRSTVRMSPTSHPATTTASASPIASNA